MATLTSAKRIVIKIGSALLVDAETGQLRKDWLSGLAMDIAAYKARDVDVVVVSSGSIALGRRVLGMGDGVLSLEQSQAAAAVGQIRLARAYEEVLEPHGIKTAQVLLTLEDSADRRRYLNSRATFTSLMSYGVVPIVNENDTVATDEIRFGDNDRLAAQVAVMSGADVLVLLSDVDGLYTGNPRVDTGAKHLKQIAEITPEIEAMAGDAGSAAAKGGMKTKIMAARTAMNAGCAMVIMEGDVERPLSALENGVKCSWFLASVDPNAARKTWIAGMRSAGVVMIDQGAAVALGKGNSLLPAGVKGTQGTFSRGDVVKIQNEEGRDLALGLVGYDAGEIETIKGKKSDRIEALLGYPGRAALIHRDDMVML